MAYDENDPADVAIVNAAVAAAEEALNLTHENAIKGLKRNNDRLLAQIKTLKDGGAVDNNAEIERLETELDTSKTLVATLQRDHAKVLKERDTFKTNAEKATANEKKLLIDTSLTTELTGVNVASVFMPAVKALLVGQASIKEEGEARTVIVGDKPLGEFIKEWSQGDQGKHYIAAANNSGGGSHGNPQGGNQSKKVKDMSEAERVAYVKQYGDVAFKTLQAAG